MALTPGTIWYAVAQPRPPTLTPTPYFRDTETPGPSPTVLRTPGGPDRRIMLPYTYKTRRTR